MGAAGFEPVTSRVRSERCPPHPKQRSRASKRHHVEAVDGAQLLLQRGEAMQEGPRKLPLTGSGVKPRARPGVRSRIQMARGIACELSAASARRGGGW
jgi:hypothetical protein